MPRSSRPSAPPSHLANSQRPAAATPLRPPPVPGPATPFCQGLSKEGRIGPMLKERTATGISSVLGIAFEDQEPRSRIKRNRFPQLLDESASLRCLLTLKCRMRRRWWLRMKKQSIAVTSNSSSIPRAYPYHPYDPLLPGDEPEKRRWPSRGNPQAHPKQEVPR